MAPALLALLFGVSVGLAIGPVAILILTLAATQGFPAGLRAGLGAAAADFCYALLAFLGGSALSERAQALKFLDRRAGRAAPARARAVAVPPGAQHR